MPEGLAEAAFDTIHGRFTGLEHARAPSAPSRPVFYADAPAGGAALVYILPSAQLGPVERRSLRLYGSGGSLQLDTITMGVVEVGAGAGRPLVVLSTGSRRRGIRGATRCRRWPMPGSTSVAPDQRGFGATDGAGRLAEYTMLHLVGDIVGLIDALGAAGRDRRPRLGRARCVEHRAAPSGPGPGRRRDERAVPAAGPGDFLDGPRHTFGERFYQLYFQGDADAGTGCRPDARSSRLLRRPQRPDGEPLDLAPARGVASSKPAGPETLPPWLTGEHRPPRRGVQTSGFRGGLNWYRTAMINQPLLRPWTGKLLEVPAAFITGELVRRAPLAGDERCRSAAAGVRAPPGAQRGP